MSKEKNKENENQESFPQKIINSEKFSSYLKYSSMGFALLGAALLGYWLGSWLDAYFSLEKPYFTALLIALFSLSYIAKVVIDLTRS